jgi:hypothetical protein
MEFALGRIYAKFYICQILNAMSYIETKRQELEFQQLIEDNMTDMNNEIENSNSNLSNNLTSEADIERREKERVQNENNNYKKKESLTKSINSLEENPQLKRYFYYKNIIYSKVEIQGLVVEKRVLGYEEKNNLRFIIFIDDTTGVMQAISWKNKNDSIYKKIEKELVRYF